MRVKGRNPCMARPAAEGEDSGRDGEGEARPLMLKPWGFAPQCSRQCRGKRKPKAHIPPAMPCGEQSINTFLFWVQGALP